MTMRTPQGLVQHDNMIEHAHDRFLSTYPARAPAVRDDDGIVDRGRSSEKIVPGGTDEQTVTGRLVPEQARLLCRPIRPANRSSRGWPACAKAGEPHFRELEPAGRVASVD
jgi:hypothetical protein